MLSLILKKQIIATYLVLFYYFYVTDECTNDESSLNQRITIFYFIHNSLEFHHQ